MVKDLLCRICCKNMFVSQKWHVVDCIKHKIWVEIFCKRIDLLCQMSCGKLFVSQKWHVVDCVEHKIWVEMFHKRMGDLLCRAFMWGNVCQANMACCKLYKTHNMSGNVTLKG